MKTLHPVTKNLFFVLTLCAAGSSARPPAPSPFEGKVLAAPHIYVESLAQFVKWSGEPVPPGDFDPEDFKRTRLGTVTFGAGLKVHIDFIENLVHFPSYYELVDTSTGGALGRYDVFDREDGDWYFSGNGAAYLNRDDLSLCGVTRRATTKIAQQGRRLIEVTQPLMYIGAEAEAGTSVRLHESPTSSAAVVATLLPKTKFLVLGLLHSKSKPYETVFLVKTPLGLTGWFVPDPDATRSEVISIYRTCN